jgi:hypothetical protein
VLKTKSDRYEKKLKRAEKSKRAAAGARESVVTGIWLDAVATYAPFFAM